MRSGFPETISTRTRLVAELDEICLLSRSTHNPRGISLDAPVKP